MNEEEINKMFHRIELDKANDTCGFEFADGFNCTFDNIATCYDDRLKLYEIIKQLEHNWNELKKYIGLEWCCFDNESVEYEVAKDILDKISELEEGGNNE